MQNHIRPVVVGVFDDKRQAQAAVDELRRVGFTDDRIGVAARDESIRAEVQQSMGDRSESYAEEGAALGVAGGTGVGAIWGLAVAGGAIPAIGPVIAGGTLAAILASAALGAATGGLVGVLIGWGLPEEEAQGYEHELQENRILVAVRVNGRTEEARQILRNHHARTEPYAHAAR
jgi:hypothetical protein